MLSHHFLCLPLVSALFIALIAPSVARAADANDFVNSQGNLEFQIDSTRSLQLAKPSATCNSANEGAIYYDSTTNHALMVCNGTAWQVVGTTSGSGLGYGQTWQNMTASRALGTIYTNSTSKPISVMANCVGVFQVAIYVDSTYLATTGNSTGYNNAITWIVPPGSTYALYPASGSCSLGAWFELR